MCGITCIFSKLESEQALEIGKIILDDFKYRGPNDNGIEYSKCEKNFANKVIIGNVRLSIQDLSKEGHQPFLNSTGRYKITFNGEIYNFLELRKDLEEKKVHFKSNTDTEVLVEGFSLYGTDFFQQLNGMFSFLIHDLQTNELYIVRDPYAIKPLYYTNFKEGYIFSSEAKSIIKTKLINFKPNEAIVFDFLALGNRDHTFETMFEDIKQFPPGHWGKLDDSGKLEIFKFKEFLKKPKYKKINNELIHDVKKKLEKSVNIRLRADVPIGVNLSGGLDSSTVTVLAKNESGKKIKTFSAIFPGSDIDESFYVDLLTKEQIIDPTFITPRIEEVKKELPKIIEVQGEPFPSLSIVVQYFVFKAVKEKGVVVVLGGQGADEIFAGYDYYFDYYYKKLAGTFKWISLYKELKKKKTFENKSFSLKEYRKYLIKGVASSFIPVFLKNPLLKRKIYFMNPKSTKKYVNQKRVGYARNYDLRNFLISEITNFSIPPLMAYEDRNSMAHSIEARVPFLDLDVVDIALEIASKLHLNEGMYKFVLRNAINGELPDKIAWNNKKIGFEVPEKEWMLGIEDEIQNLLQNDLWIYNLIDKTFILDLLLNFKNLDKFHLRILWRCYSTQLWYNNFQKLS